MAESGDWSVSLRCCVLEPPGAAFVLLELSVKLMQLRKKDAWRWCLGALVLPETRGWNWLPVYSCLTYDF